MIQTTQGGLELKLNSNIQQSVHVEWNRIPIALDRGNLLYRTRTLLRLPNTLLLACVLKIFSLYIYLSLSEYINAPS